MTELWTVGHGARPLDAFIEALLAHRIEVLADVRSFPASRRHPHFSQEPLREALGQAGLRYVHIVDLGGYRKEGYAAHMGTAAWQAGFATLAELARHARVAICCAETVPLACHRRFVAAHALARGWQVTHILDAKRTLPGKAARQARLDETEGS